MVRRTLFQLLVCLSLSATATQTFAQAGFYESEPNNTPAQANEISGEVILYGSMVDNDQDGYLWTVTDDDARKLWNFELHGTPGALTIVELVRVEYTADGDAVAGVDRLMKMGTRDGVTPSIHRDQLFDPGVYLIGVAYAGGPKPSAPGGGLLGLKPGDLKFGENGQPQTDPAAAPVETTQAAAGAYRLIITESGPLNPSGNAKAREERENALKMRLGRSYAVFETRQTTWYQFDFDEGAASERWDIEARAPIGRPLVASLTDAEGNVLVEKRTDAHGRALFADLAPEATSWYLKLSTDDPGFYHRVRSEAVGQRVTGEEAEPNGKQTLANRADFSAPVTGRVGGDDTWDYFTFEIGEDTADRLHTLKLETTPETKLRFCLYSDEWTTLQCRDTSTPVELPDLLLTPGVWGVSLSRASEVEYTLSLEQQGVFETGMEAEPNDIIAAASAVPSNFRIKGRFSGDDIDIYRFLVPNESQLWRFQVIGEGIREVAYYDGSGKQKQSLRIRGGQRRVRLDNLFLLPGTHYLRVTGSGEGSGEADYTVLARPLGPPDPNGEMEPNDKSNMQRLAIGQTRTGLLAEENDSDYYRFFLGNRDHIRLTVQPPADGIVNPDIHWYGQTFGDGQPGNAGEPMVIEGLFPPGDYHVVLSPNQVSDAEYRLTLERLPRFSCPADCEPTGLNQIFFASPLPADLELNGSTGEWRDWDYYQLPAFNAPAELLIHSQNPVRELSLGSHYRVRERLTHGAELGAYRATVAAGTPQRLMINSNKQNYALRLEFPNGEIKAVTEPLPAKLELKLSDDQVSAYRLMGQQLTGSLNMTNSADAPLEIELEAVLSDYRWQIDLEKTALALAPGGQDSIAFTVTVPSDAWASDPVRVSMRAFEPGGRQTETWSEITVNRDIAAVNPRLFWPIPESLRGGFNAAWLPFNAQWVEQQTEDIRYADLLRDGLVFAGTQVTTASDGDGWSEEEKPIYTLELPGDELLPVAGVVINLFGTSGAYMNIREATVLVSTDGVDYTEALQFETLPVRTEQHFAFEQPLPARFVRLKIDSTYQEPSSQRASASEWKIILEPGHDLSAGKGFDIARPELGGHVVWDDPPEPYSPNSILQDENHSESAGMKRGPQKDYVIGFLQNRAAQITGIDWLYPEELAERWKNFERVDVSVSLESPVGPWLPLGQMDLSGSKTTAQLRLDKPHWARFVRLTAYKSEEAQGSHEPGLIRIWERPTSPDYLSVLTEWGSIGPRAYYELAAGDGPEPALVASGNTSRATAATLQPGALARGQVSLAQKREHWFRLTVPPGDNSLTIDLAGDPTVRTVLEAQDRDGNSIPLRRLDREITPALRQFEATLEPGSDLWMRVAEPPRNVVFSWDTSASVNAYIPLINNSLVAFSGGVVPGQEAVNLIPFAMGPLLDQWYGEPYVLQTILNDYRRGSSSSSAEWTLKGAARHLAPRPGTKAIMVITDGETVHHGEMWAEMKLAQPRVFSVQVAGSELWNHNVMRDWAIVNGGHFTQLVYDGEMEIAFDRASALMHRPADYTLRVETGYREAPGPGQLSIINSESAKAKSGGAAVELILDASGSMLQRIEGKRRIAVAKDVLTEAVKQHIPPGTPVALRVFGHREADSCRTDLEIPLAPLDPSKAASTIAAVNAMNLARTPIADSLAAVESDLKGATNGIIVLVTDGEETCEGDPGAVIEALQAKGLKVSLNIVGFAIKDLELAAQFQSWATLGGGRYFSADNQHGLSEAIEQALQISYAVYDHGGNEVAVAQVGGDAVSLERGVYRVVVNTVPPTIFEQVAVQGEDEILLKLE